MKRLKEQGGNGDGDYVRTVCKDLSNIITIHAVKNLGMTQVFDRIGRERIGLLPGLCGGI